MNKNSLEIAGLLQQGFSAASTSFQGLLPTPENLARLRSVTFISSYCILDVIGMLTFNFSDRYLVSNEIPSKCQSHTVVKKMNHLVHLMTKLALIF